MVAFSSSFRVFLLGAVVLGMSASAAPNPGGPGSPGSQGSKSSGGGSWKSTKSGFSVKTADGSCMANSRSQDRYIDKEFLELFPEFSQANRRRGNDDEFGEVAFEFDTRDRPNPSSKITLFHGTPPRFAGSLYKGVRIFPNPGDLSANGAFYLTNSLRAAAQWGCHGRGEDGSHAVVFEYEWDGTQEDLKIRSYEEWEGEEEYADFCTYNNCPNRVDISPEAIARIKAIADKDYDMIAGPMMPVGGDITSGFYQYALRKETKAKAPYLTQKNYHLLSCSKFPKGEIDTRDTQGPVSKFSDAEMKDIGLTLQENQDKPPADWAEPGAKITLAARPKYDS